MCICLTTYCVQFRLETADIFSVWRMETLYIVCIDSVVDGALDSRSEGPEFESHPLLCLARPWASHSRTCLRHQAVSFCTNISWGSKQAHRVTRWPRVYCAAASAGAWLRATESEISTP